MSTLISCFSASSCVSEKDQDRHFRFPIPLSTLFFRLLPLSLSASRSRSPAATKYYLPFQHFSLAAYACLPSKGRTCRVAQCDHAAFCILSLGPRLPNRRIRLVHPHSLESLGPCLTFPSFFFLACPLPSLPRSSVAGSPPTVLLGGPFFFPASASCRSSPVEELRS